MAGPGIHRGEHAKPWEHHAGPESGQENPWGAISKQIEASAQRKERYLELAAKYINQ